MERLRIPTIGKNNWNIWKCKKLREEKSGNLEKKFVVLPKAVCYAGRFFEVANRVVFVLPI